MKLIGQAHSMLHEKGIVRIQTDIRVGSRYVLLQRIDWLGVRGLMDGSLGRIRSSLSARRLRLSIRY